MFQTTYLLKNHFLLSLSLDERSRYAVVTTILVVALFNTLLTLGVLWFEFFSSSSTSPENKQKKDNPTTSDGEDPESDPDKWKRYLFYLGCAVVVVGLFWWGYYSYSLLSFESAPDVIVDYVDRVLDLNYVYTFFAKNGDFHWHTQFEGTAEKIKETLFKPSSHFSSNILYAYELTHSSVEPLDVLHLEKLTQEALDRYLLFLLKSQPR